MAQQTPTMPDLESIIRETNEINLILNKGVHFTVPKKSLFRLFGKPERKFEIQQVYAGTLVFLCKYLISLKFSEADLQSDPFDESKRIVAENSAVMGRIVAIMVLRDKWKIKLFLPFLANYFLWRITPTKLREITEIILTIANIPDFIHSTRYLSIKKRVTAPALVETSPEENQ